MFYIILEALSLAFAISLDTLVVAICYGTSKIKIPFLSAFIMALFNVFVLSLSIFLGAILGNHIDTKISKIISFSLLLTVGLFKFLSEMIKIWLNKRAEKGYIKLKLFNFSLMLSVIADPNKADVNKDKMLSVVEALTLALILSIDSIGVGFSIGVSNVNFYIIAAFSFILSLFFIPLGSFLGKKLAGKVNLSWLSGFILIILAIIKLI